MPMNHDNPRTTIRLLGIAALALLATGCAANSELAELQETQQQLESRLQGLEQRISSARDAAEAAQSSADEARAIAEEAQACCENNTERMDRLFERAVQKN